MKYSPTDMAHEAPTSELERKFHFAMLEVYNGIKRETGYNAGYFLKMVTQKGGVMTAHDLLAKQGFSKGLRKLRLAGRLDLSAECQVLRPLFVELFSPEERNTARERLASLGYKPPS